MESSYLERGMALPYCRGCSHGLILRALGEALETLRLPPAELAIVTDIGCVGLADAQFATPHTIHTTHGRSTAFATGLSVADSALGSSRLKPVVLIGDGGAMMGINHLVHAALLNPEVTVLVHNNFLFGMTGGQNSAFSPLDFITSTTPAGNTTPPLDLARVLIASRASFVARKLAGDRDMTEVIARAIAHPGFAVVEILELCTAYATRWNPLTGVGLHDVAERAGYELGILCDQPRPTFGASNRQHPASTNSRGVAGVAKNRERGVVPGQFTAQLEQPLGLVLAGTAGERVQTAASLLGQAAMLAGLQVTQKNDNPVTQGTGFSVCEIILSPEEILFTGIEQPDTVLVVSSDGARELARSGVFARVAAETLLLADTAIELPDLPCTVLRFPFRPRNLGTAGSKVAALAAIVTWLDMTCVLPLDALWAALEIRFEAQAEAMKGTLVQFVQTV